MGQDPALPSYHGGDLHLLVRADLTELTLLRRRVTRWACGTALSHSTVEDLALATYEAMANVVEHAYGDSGGDLEVLGMVEPDQASVTITVLDRGSWRSPPKNPNGLRGRGLVLVRGLADEVDVVVGAGGTTVRMRWDLPATRFPGWFARQARTQEFCRFHSIEDVRCGTPRGLGVLTRHQLRVAEAPTGGRERSGDQARRAWIRRMELE